MSGGAEEEWADGVDDFFAEFSSSATQGKSARRQNAEAHQATVTQAQKQAERREVDRVESAEEARRRITAAVAGRATAKEIEAAARNAKKHQKIAQKKQRVGGAAAGPSPTSHAAAAAASSSPSTSASSAAGVTGKRAEVPQTDGEGPAARLGKRRQKIDAKFARKAARKEEAKENRIKYRRVLRKQRR